MTTAENGSRRSAPGWETGRPSIAIVGAGFGGIGAAVMLRRAGYTDTTVFEKRRARRRRLELQLLPRHRLRCPLAPLRVLVRAQPGLVAALLARPRDPGLPGATSRATTVCSIACASTPR